MPNKNYVIELPSLFADHHVLEVRKLVSELKGVTGIYASSAFRLIEVETDGSIKEDDITKILSDAGYLDELPISGEIEISPAEQGGKSKVFRHSAIYDQTHKALSFKQEVDNRAKPLWPCPGMGPVVRMEE